VLTPPGTGAIAVIRVAGPTAVQVVERLWRPRQEPGVSFPQAGAEADERPDDTATPVPLCATAPGCLRYGRLVDDDETIDDVIVCITADRGVPAVDICAHGGARVTQRILAAAERAGADLATTAELAALWPTAGIIDEEALDCIAHTHTERGVRFFAWQRLHLPDELRQLASLCDVDPPAVRQRLENMLAGFREAQVLRNGLRVALTGPPNSGKSTLFNRLVGRAAAVVSAHPGTTRDWVTAEVQVLGVAVALVDTAGDRVSEDTLELSAIEGGRCAVESAEVVVLVLDGTEERASGRLAGLLRTPHRAPTVAVLNKADVWLRPGEDGEVGGAWMPVSALTGLGVEALAEAVLRAAGVPAAEPAAPVLFTARQAAAACGVLSDLKRTPEAVGARMLRALLGEGK